MLPPRRCLPLIDDRLRLPASPRPRSDKMSQQSGSATLPRGFRFETPSTPEPFSGNGEADVPAPPRARLRLKRRVVSNFTAPTQHFLASVAAADVPVPSIEEPEPEPEFKDFDMVGIAIRDGDSDFLMPPSGGTQISPPKTPAPASAFVPSLSPRRYPNWTVDSAVSSSVESTPEYESSRPSTSRSTLTDSSLFSRFSHGYDDDNDCEIPEAGGNDKYLLVPDEISAAPRVAAPKGKAKARKAPWTKAMSDHLWSTFMLYLQDPKVTPVRMGKSCIPPHGVCLRVAREAKRSWKGAKGFSKAANPEEGKKSGSTTPTAVSSGTFIQWPHTCAATRAHMRELCKSKAASGTQNNRFLSRSATPFHQASAQRWNRRPTPARVPGAFATQDMSMSLALSTSDSMQPQGPLAQLARSSPERLPRPATPDRTTPGPLERPPSPPNVGHDASEEPRLGSPFGANSYGPSSSGSLAAALGLNGSVPRRQSQTVGPRRTLQSPVRLGRSGTQKRRNTQSSDSRRRPVIGSDLWVPPVIKTRPRAGTAVGTEFSSTSFSRRDELFIPRISNEALAPLILPANPSGVDAPQLLAPPDMPPPRLGSPFSASTSSSQSFPNRLHRSQHAGSIDLGMLGRPFATIQQVSEPSAPPGLRGNLAGRLAYIDQRLKELRNRDTRRRSESPL